MQFLAGWLTNHILIADMDYIAVPAGVVTNIRFWGKTDEFQGVTECLLLAISGHLRTGKSMLEIMEERQNSRSGRRLRATLSSPTLLRESGKDC